MTGVKIGNLATLDITPVMDISSLSKVKVTNNVKYCYKEFPVKKPTAAEIKKFPKLKELLTKTPLQLLRTKY